MSFFPVDRNLPTSSIWVQGTPEQFKVWLYLLLSARVKDGVVEDTDPAIALRCGLTLEATTAALEWLAAPDAFSRTKDHRGRRIKRLDRGGIQVLNYEKYRDKDHSTPRVRRHRQRLKDKRNGVSSFHETAGNDGHRKRDKGKARANTEKADGRSVPSARISMTAGTIAEIDAAASELAQLRPDCSVPEWITTCSYLPPGNGFDKSSSFSDPRGPRLSEEWGKSTLKKLQTKLHEARHPLPLHL